MIGLMLRLTLKLAHDLGLSCAVAGVTGLLSHSLFFVRGYHVLSVTKIICVHLSAYTLLLAGAVLKTGFLLGARNSATIFTSYLASLFLSITVYRLAFHPLRRFPGPFQAKVTKLYGPWLARHRRLHEEFRSLHQKHGAFVRVGPNELSISHIDALQKVHGLQTPCSKKNNGGYEAIAFRGESNLNSITDHAEHRVRRQVWDKALSRTSLLSYETATRTVIQSWLAQLGDLGGAPVDTTLYAKHLAFDNMGHIGYSKDFRSIQGQGETRMLDMIGITFSTLASLGQLTWPLVLLLDLPRFGLQKEFEELAVSLVDERMEREKHSGDLHDMMKGFIEDFRSSNSHSFWNRNILYADSQAILVASTETIACALAFSFFFLTQDPSLRRRVREAIAPAYGRTLPGEFTTADLQSIELLDAVINETLRMAPPVALNGPRSTPPQGLEIGGQFIPGNIHVFTPPHVYHRSPEFFRDPDEFIVERWTSRPDLIIDRRAFHPFSLGRYDCVGKALALNVLRLTIAYTVWHYDFELAPGESASAFLNGSVDLTIVKPAALKCVFTRLSPSGPSDHGSAAAGGKQSESVPAQPMSQSGAAAEVRQRFVPVALGEIASEFDGPSDIAR